MCRANMYIFSGLTDVPLQCLYTYDHCGITYIDVLASGELTVVFYNSEFCLSYTVSLVLPHVGCWDKQGFKSQLCSEGWGLLSRVSTNPHLCLYTRGGHYIDKCITAS